MCAIVLVLALLLGLASGQQLAGTYWDLARCVVPAKFSKAFELLGTLTQDSGPDDVKPLRVSLLAAREALDIFEFAYSAHSKYNKDVWKMLRRDLDSGYEQLGDFQDLAHSLVEYNNTDVVTRREACLQWCSCIQNNRRNYCYDDYVSWPEHGKMCHHSHTSKLFWGYAGAKPDGGLTGLENMVVLLHAQMDQIFDNMTVVVSLQHVYDEPDHTHFHLFRKLIRSTLAVLDFFPELLPRKSTQAALTAQAAEAKPTHRMLSRALMVDFRPMKSMHMKASAGQEKVKEQGSRTVSKDVRVGQGATTRDCDPDAALTNFQALFKSLGQVNNQAFAVNFYSERKMISKAEAARQECDKQWAGVTLWMKNVNFQRQVQCLGDSVSAPDAMA